MALLNYCTCCERKLNPAREVWLELNSMTGTYHRDGEVSADDSQGGFPFGPGCAKRILANGGSIREAA